MNSSNGYRYAWLGMSLALALIVTSIMSVPFVPAEWRLAIHLSFSSVCHQLPGRSFHIDHIPFAVCHRCFGIYTGLAVSLLTGPLLYFTSKQKEWLPLVMFGSLGLLSIDWMLPLLEIAPNTMFSRVLTGLLFGLSAGYFFYNKVLTKTVRPSQEGTIEIPERNFV